MNLPTITTRSLDWGVATNRIFDDVGTKIRETRRIQHILRYVICGIGIFFVSLLYWVAMINA